MEIKITADPQDRTVGKSEEGLVGYIIQAGLGNRVFVVFAFSKDQSVFMMI